MTENDENNTVPVATWSKSTPTAGTTDPMGTPATSDITQDGDGLVLEARSISKSYRVGIWPHRRTRSVLAGADLTLGKGEIVGLVGENGSGKSTLMKILVGSISRDAGEIRTSGQVGYCPQEPVLYDRLTCNEHFELFGEAYGLTHAEMIRSRDAVYDTLGFADWADARVEELSGGTSAKLNLGLALQPDPQVLLLDEPYAGFDWDTYLRFWEITAERRASGRSLLIISHFITDEERFDRIYDLRNGITVAR